MTRLLDLKGKLKVGMTVSETRKDEESACAKLWNGESAKITKVSDRRVEFNDCFHFWTSNIDLDIPLTPSWETLKKGDVMVDDFDKWTVIIKWTVIEVLGDIFWTTCGDKDESRGALAWTIAEAKENGYTLQGAEAPVDEDVEKAIKLLTDRGVLVDGKVIK